MTKKDLPTAIRQMHGFGAPSAQNRRDMQVVSDMADKILNPAKMRTAGEILAHDAAKEAAKDKLIAELRASLAELEALRDKDASRRAKQRARTAKVRAKK